MTGPGEEEIRVAWEILKALKLRERGVDVVACPTCGRLQFDMWPVVEELEKRLATVAEPMTVAIMGCAVNGPGEAKDAKIGVAGGKRMGLLYRDGQIVRRVEQENMVEEVWREVQDVLREGRSGGGAVAEGDHSQD
jgi:(E)-4-hydroxy-3-methylbut-2-enyl-diphosphate synthase